MTQPRTVQILDKEYTVHCPAGQEEALQAAVVLLDQKMREIRHSGRVVGAERIAIMAALNIAHTAILARNHTLPPFAEERLQGLHDRIDAVLSDVLVRDVTQDPVLETTD